MTITFAEIKALCTNWINDPDISIGMECMWEDFLVEKINIEANSEEIMKALNVSNKNEIVSIEVEHNKWGTQDIYISIYDNMIEISTKKWLLTSYKR